MVSRPQMEACMRLTAEGLKAVGMPHMGNTPIPGVLLYADEGHKRLLMVLADGRAVDLLKLYHASVDCVRNWHKDNPLHLPHFVGDFGRLNRIAKAAWGEQYAGDLAGNTGDAVTVPQDKQL